MSADVLLERLTIKGAVNVLRIAQERGWINGTEAEPAFERPPAQILESVIHDESRAFGIFVGEDLCGYVVLERITLGTPPIETLSVVRAGGERMAEWVDVVQATLQRIAAEWECARVVIAGRIGWERELRRHGWKRQAVILTAPAAGRVAH